MSGSISDTDVAVRLRSLPGEILGPDRLAGFVALVEAEGSFDPIDRSDALVALAARALEIGPYRIGRVVGLSSYDAQLAIARGRNALRRVGRNLDGTGRESTPTSSPPQSRGPA